MPRIVLLVGPFPPPIHGASRVAQLVASALTDKESVHVEVVDTNCAKGYLYHPSRILRHFLACVKIVWLRFRREDLVVYQTGAGGLGLWYQALVALVSRLVGTPHVFHHHNYSYLARRSRGMVLCAKAGGASTLHVVLSSGMGRELETAYGVRNSVVFSNAAVLGPSSAESGGNGGSGFIDKGSMPVVGHLSNLSYEKGTLHVLDIVERLNRGATPVRLVLAGPAGSRQVEEKIADHLAKNPSSEWIGRLAPAEVPRFMRGLDCFLFPSLYRNEALPLVVLEALREGTPVVCTPVGCLTGLLQGVGWLAEGTDEFVAGVSRLVADSAAREKAVTLYAQEYSKASSDDLANAILRSAVGN